MSTFWSPQLRSDWEKKGGVQNVRFTWEMKSSETWPTRLRELPMSGQVKMRWRRELLSVSSELKGTCFLVVADHTASTEPSWPKTRKLLNLPLDPFTEKCFSEYSSCSSFLLTWLRLLSWEQLALSQQNVNWKYDMHYSNDSNFTMRVNNHLYLFSKDIYLVWTIYNSIPCYKEMLYFN